MTVPEPLDVYIPGDPFPQPRVRSTAVGGHVRHYFKKEVGLWKRMASDCARVIMGGRDDWPEPFDGPLLVSSTFYFECRKGRRRKTAPAPARFHWKKPDKDNLEKALLDALNGVVWTDDARVVSGRQEKVECRQGGIPGTVVTVLPLHGLLLHPRWGCSLDHAESLRPGTLAPSTNTP